MSGFPQTLDALRDDLVGTQQGSAVGHAGLHNAIADAVMATQAEVRRREVNVTHYGLIGDGTTDCAPPLTALLASVGRSALLTFPRPAVYYRFNSAVNVPRANDYCRFLGLGPGRYTSRPNSEGAVILRRAGNGPILTIAALGVRLDSLCFDGDTFTGPLVQLTALIGIGDQVVSECGFLNVHSYGVEITNGGAAQRSKFEHLSFDPYTGLGGGAGYAGIRFPDDIAAAETSGDRWVVDCMATSQSILLDLNNSINTNIVNVSGANGCILFGATSRKAIAVGSRITGGLVIHGNQHGVIGNTLNGGNVVLDTDSSDCTLGPNAWPWTGGYTITDLGSRNTINDRGYIDTAVSGSSSMTISTANIRLARVNPAAAITGVILQAGTYTDQRVTVMNQGSGSSSITFATGATSNVAQGTSAVIASGTTRTFVWDGPNARWY